MSATLIPTQTSGARPPTPPIVKTAFGAEPDDEGDSVLVKITDDVRWTIRHADASEGDNLPTMIDALVQRRRWVETELATTRMMTSFALPAIDGFSIDYLLKDFDPFERALVGLIEDLDDCHARSERRLARHRLQMRLLRDLGTSDS